MISRFDTRSSRSLNKFQHQTLSAYFQPRMNVTSSGDLGFMACLDLPALSTLHLLFSQGAWTISSLCLWTIKGFWGLKSTIVKTFRYWPSIAWQDVITNWISAVDGGVLLSRYEQQNVPVLSQGIFPNIYITGECESCVVCTENDFWLGYEQVLTVHHLDIMTLLMRIWENFLCSKDIDSSTKTFSSWKLSSWFF